MLVVYQLQFDYTLVNEIMLNVKRFGCTIIENEMQLFCRMKIGIPKEQLEECIGRLKDIHGVEMSEP
jgi:hypothetical protein